MGHIDALIPSLRLNNESEFIWGQHSKKVFENIKQYLFSPPVLKAPRRGIPFKLYVVAEDKVIGVVLTQETEDMEYVITYISRRLIDTETKNNQVEYEVLLFGLEFLQSMGVKHVEALGDSLLVVQQVFKVC